MTCPKCGKDSPANWILCEDCIPTATSPKKPSAKTRRMPENLQRRKSKHTFRYLLISLSLVAAIAGTVYFEFGFYTIPPVDSIPEGATLIVWRGGDTSQPFFNSPDAEMSKITVQKYLPQTDLVPSKELFRLPYIEFFYLQSPTNENLGK